MSVLADYSVRLIVAGSRNYDDYINFSKGMSEFIKTFGNKSIIYITGKARTGADALIIRWCIEHNYPWIEFPANWDALGKSAGYVRNVEMAAVATDLIVWYDGISRGTKHMVDTANRKGLSVTTMLINVVKKELPNVREQSSS